VTTTGPPLAGPPPLSSAALASDKWLARFRTILVVILGCTVTGIASLAFYTSFEAIRAYSERSEGISPQHAWAIPLLVDSFIIVATGADLWFTTTKARRRLFEVVWPKLLLAGAALVSFVLNVAHAQHNWPARFVAAIPPAALVLGVELLMMVLRRSTTIRSQRLQAEMDARLAAEAAAAAAALPALPPVPMRGELLRKQRTRPRREVSAPLRRTAVDDFVEAAAAEAATYEPRPRPRLSERPADRPADRLAESDRDPRAPIFGDDGGVERRPPLPPKVIVTPRTATPGSGGNGPRPAVNGPRPGGVTQSIAKPPQAQAQAPASGTTATATTTRAATATATARARREQQNNGKPATPYVVAARILDERDANETFSPEQLMQALAERGVSVNMSTAQGLLRELRPPLATRLGAQPPAQATGAKASKSRR